MIASDFTLKGNNHSKQLRLAIHHHTLSCPTEDSKLKRQKGEYLLIISLLDNTHYPRKDFAGHYPMRWQIEEAYNVLNDYLMALEI